VIVGIAVVLLGSSTTISAEPGNVFQVVIAVDRMSQPLNLLDGAMTTLCLRETVHLRAMCPLGSSSVGSILYKWDRNGDGHIDEHGESIDISSLTDYPGTKKVVLYALDTDDESAMASQTIEFNVLPQPYPVLQAQANKVRTENFMLVVGAILVVGFLAAGLISASVSF